MIRELLFYNIFRKVKLDINFILMIVNDCNIVSCIVMIKKNIKMRRSYSFADY
jgi:hypothetical protein